MTYTLEDFKAGTPLPGRMRVTVHIAEAMRDMVPKRRWRRRPSPMHFVPAARALAASLFFQPEGQQIVSDIVAEWDDPTRAEAAESLKRLGMVTIERDIPTPMREWVVGFAVDPLAQKVVLIRKNRPPWQAGKLNGVGGKVEPGETLAEAMRREFQEETGVFIDDWEPMVAMTAVSTEDRSGQITSEEGIVHFFRCHQSIEPLARHMRSATDEEISVHHIRDLGWLDVIPNLRWMVPLAAHTHDQYQPMAVRELSTTLRRNPSEAS